MHINLAKKLAFICFLVLPVFAHAEPLSSEQIHVEAECINAIIFGGPSLLDQALDECPSSMPGNRIAGVELSRKQISLINRILSVNVNTRLRGLTPAGKRSRSDTSTTFLQTGSGFNAGDLFNQYGIWGNLAYDDLENDFVNTPYDSDTITFMAGIDIQPVDRMLIGFAVGYENTDVDTDFNTGEQDIDGYTLAGYFGYLFNDYISIDLSGGYSSIDIEQTRLSDSLHLLIDPVFLGLPVGTRINGELDADRIFFSGNLNGFWEINNFLLEAHIGYLWAEEDHDRFFESAGGITDVFSERELELGQFRTGLNVAYTNSTSFEPYFGIDYINETTREDLRLLPGMAQPDNDEDEFLFSLGLRYFGTQGITGDLQWNISAGRDDIDAHALMFLLRADL